MTRVNELIKEFFDILDVVETSDGGVDFHPTRISSCRCMTVKRLDEIFKELKNLIKDK